MPQAARRHVQAPITPRAVARHIGGHSFRGCRCKHALRLGMVECCATLKSTTRPERIAECG